MFRLDSDDFQLELFPMVFETDIEYPENTTLNIKVVSDGFSADATMDVDVKTLAEFAKDLLHLYKSLSGKARLEEPYGVHNYIEFEAITKGYITVKGNIHHRGRSGYSQELSFENHFDQTFLQDFTKRLFAEYGQYLG